MNYFKIYLTALFAVILGSPDTSVAQDRPLYQWRSHLPYNEVLGTATDGNQLFVAGRWSFFTYNLSDKEITTYAKEHGMADVGLSCIGYDALNQTAVIAYANSNIDLFKDGTFSNIPFLKLKNTSGDKAIYQVYCDAGKAYLSTGIGVLALDVARKEVKETYSFSDASGTYAVYNFASGKDTFYVATAKGIYKTAKTNAMIQYGASWTLVDASRAYKFVAVSQGNVYAASADSVFQIRTDGSFSLLFTNPGSVMRHLDPTDKGLAVSSWNATRYDGSIVHFDATGARLDSFESTNPVMISQTLDGTLWVADQTNGLLNKSERITPSGPRGIGGYDLICNDRKVYVAHGAYDDRWNLRLNREGISVLDNNSWTTYNLYTFPPFNDLVDAVRMAKDPTDNTLYIASQVNGLFWLKEDKSAGNLRETVFEPHLIDPSSYRLSGVAFDGDNNLWVTQTDAPHELMAKSAKDGQWYKFGLPSTRPRPYFENGAAGLIIDDYGQQWFFSPAGGGLLVYNSKGTLEDASDDEYTRLQMGVGLGNLPDNQVQCIVNDKKGVIWVGTSNGIGIISCPDQVIAGQCETEIRVVQYDNFAGQLFNGEVVKTIAVDGANRKWVGTGNGVWLISDDAGKIIFRFTKDNSPLPSNSVQTIKVDPIDGSVYIATDEGLVSFRSTATDGGTENKNVLVYPNPIRHSYSGPIAIKGLVNNADVRITDVSGQLVYRTKANGGTAVWDGKDYTGRRPQSGVYLIFATNSDGTQTYAGKMVFIK
ncbi:MAG: two-component regulator propeller domain-containing protein [Chitinophagaceae bacterium]